MRNCCLSVPLIYGWKHNNEEPGGTNFWVGTSCIHGYLYKERYGAKYLGWSVVRYLYTRTRVLKIIRCLMGSQ